MFPFNETQISPEQRARKSLKRVKEVSA